MWYKQARPEAHVPALFACRRLIHSFYNRMKKGHDGQPSERHEHGQAKSASCTKVSQPGSGLPLPDVDDCFCQYEPSVYDDGDPNAGGSAVRCRSA